MVEVLQDKFMKGNMEVKTKYNIGDKVFIVSREFKYGDSYIPDITWRVKGNDNYTLEISKVLIRGTDDKSEINYVIDCSQRIEDDVFIDIEKAQKECVRRNIRDGYK